MTVQFANYWPVAAGVAVARGFFLMNAGKIPSHFWELVMKLFVVVVAILAPAALAQPVAPGRVVEIKPSERPGLLTSACIVGTASTQGNARRFVILRKFGAVSGIVVPDDAIAAAKSHGAVLPVCKAADDTITSYRSSMCKFARIGGASTRRRFGQALGIAPEELCSSIMVAAEK